MLKKTLKTMVIPSTIALCSSCALFDNPKPSFEESQQVEIEGENLETQSIHIIRDFIEGLKKEDYAKFTKRMAPELKEELTNAKFAQFAKKFNKKGNIDRAFFLGQIKRGKFTQLIYKTKYMDSEDDILIVLIGTNVDNKFQMMSFKIN